MKPSSGSDDLSPAALGLLQQVRERFLSSREFNGLHVRGEAVESARGPGVELLRAGLLQVITGADYMNIHIRPWPSLRSKEDQEQDLESLTADDYGVCLYPTVEGMKGVRLPTRMTGRPYARAMARGKGTLELAYFEFAVLEQYRNDGRFRFDFGDAGASMGLTDEAFDGDDVFERDHVGLSHIGFAYDLSGYDSKNPNSPIERRVAAFYCDLITLTPEHQRRWETYQVPDDGLQPHPIWWGSQMGRWPDAVGPFAHLFIELQNLNQLTKLAFDEQMFRVDERPADFGWLLRPSQREWDEFVLQLDKLLSENLSSQFLDRVGVPGVDERNQRIGSLNRFQDFMLTHGVSESDAKKVLAPLKTVRQARQKPAHAIRANLNDHSFIHKQINLMQDTIGALTGIRGWLSTHPACAGWKNSYSDLAAYPI